MMKKFWCVFYASWCRTDVIKLTISLTVLAPSTIRSNSFSVGSWNVSSCDWRRDELKKCPSRCRRRLASTS